MKLVLATPLYPPDIGGPARYASELRDEFSRRGIQVAVVAYGRVERSLPPVLRHIAYGFRLLMRASGADAVLALDTLSVGLPALFVARLSGAKLLIRIGGDFLWERYVNRTGKEVRLSEFYRPLPALSPSDRLVYRLTRFLLRRADRLLFTTRWQSELWADGYGIPRERMSIVENFYPAERAVPSESGKVFVSAGRDIPLKNMHRVRAAFAAAKARHPEIDLDTRTLSPDAHRTRIAAAYAVIIGSISEVNSNTAIEALACGKPFIAPKDSGALERLGDVGVFVDTLDVSELEKAIEELLQEEIYARARARIRSFDFSHSWADIAEEILAAIRA